MAKKKAKRHGAKDTGAPKNGASDGDIEKDDAATEGEEPDGEGASADAVEKEDAPARKEDAPAEKEAVKEDAPAEKEAVKAADTPEEKPAPAEEKAAPKAAAKAAPASQGAAWGAPLLRFETAWTKLETRLITWVLVAQLLSMVLWVLLSGLSSPIQSGNASGLVMRAVIGMVALGAIGWFATSKRSLNDRRIATIVGIAVGIGVAKLWRTVGVDYFDNLKSWLQEGSTLTLMGGLRGVATRLTLWLALLGASLATGSGKHINIDVIFRFVPSRFRLPVAVVNYCAAAIMCLSAVWGFFDHIAIESFGANADASASSKISTSVDRMGDHLFLTRKQIGLDFRAIPHVLSGDRYDQWMSAKAWNEWAKDAGFDAKYSKEEAESILIPEDAPPHAPLVVAPDGEATRGILVHDLSLVFPFGMLAVALRFLLRALLAISKQIEIDPDAAHKEEIGQHSTDEIEPRKGGA